MARTTSCWAAAAVNFAAAGGGPIFFAAPVRNNVNGTVTIREAQAHRRAGTRCGRAEQDGGCVPHYIQESDAGEQDDTCASYSAHHSGDEWLRDPYSRNGRGDADDAGGADATGGGLCNLRG